WPNVKLGELDVKFPELNIDWPNVSLPDLMFALPKLDLKGFSVDFDLPKLGLDWPDVSLSGLSAKFPDLNIDWANLSLPEFVLALPKLDLPNFDISLFDINLPDFAFPDIDFGSFDLDLDLSNLGFSIFGEVGFSIADMFEFSGEMGFSKLNDEIVILGEEVLALFGVGDFKAGVTDGDLALLIKKDSTVALDVAGDLVLEGAGFITDTIWADRARFQYNTSTVDYSGDNKRTLTVGSLSKDLTMAAGATGSPYMALNVYGFRAQIDGAVGLSGDFSFARQKIDSTQVMMMTGSNVTAYLGTDDINAKVSNADLAMAIFEVNATSTTYAIYALGDAAIVGVTDVTLSGTFQLYYNRTGLQTIDFGGTIGEIDYGTTANFTSLRSSNLNVSVANFFSVTGGFAIESTTSKVTLSDGQEVDVDLLTLGTKNVTAFVGVNGGTADKLGFDLTGADMALALMTDSSNSERQWMALQSSVTSAAFVGVDGLTVQAESLNVAINRNLSTKGEAVAQPDLVLDTILTLNTDLAEGELVFEYLSQQALVAVAASRSSSVIRNDIKNKLEDLLTAAGVSKVAGNILVTGEKETGFTITFGGDLSGVDYSGLLVSHKLPSVTTNVAEVTEGVPAYINKTFTPVNQNAIYHLVVNANEGTLTLNYGADSETIALTATQTDSDLITALTSKISALDGIGANNVKVTGTRAAGFDIEFIGALQGKSVHNLSASLVLPSYTTSTQTAVTGSQTTTGYNTTGTNVREVQKIQFSGATGSFRTYTLEVAGKSLGSLIFTPSNPGNNATKLQDAFDSVLGTGAVRVKFDQNSTAKDPAYFVTFGGKYAYQDIATIKVTSTNGVSVSVGTEKEGSAVTKTAITSTVAEVQNVTFASDAKGSLTLSYAVDGKTYTTSALSFAATAEQIDTALTNALGGDFAGADITVSASTGKWQITFGGALAGKDIGTIATKVAPLNGDVTLEMTQAGLVRTETTTSTTAAVAEVQQVTVKSAAKGTFTLSVDHSGNTYTTSALALTASSRDIEAALETALSGISGATIDVLGQGEGVWTVTFGGTLKGVDIALMDVNYAYTDVTTSLSVKQKGAVVEQADLIADVNPNLVVDFAVTNLAVTNAIGSTFTLDMDGARGAMTTIAADLTLDVFGFVQVSGGFYMDKAVSTVKDADGNAIEVDQLVIAGAGVDAFAGMNGGTDDQVGVKLAATDFVLGLYSERDVQDARQWTSLQASAGSLSLEGIDGVTLSGSEINVSVNRTASDGSVLDFSGDNAVNVEVLPGIEVSLNNDGDLGEYYGLNATAELGFAGISVASGIEMAYQPKVSLLDTDDTLQDFSVVKFGLTDASASLKIADVFDLSVAGLDLGISYLESQKAGDTRSWLFADGSADTISSAAGDVASLDLSKVKLHYGQALHGENAELLNLSLNPIEIAGFTQANSDTEAYFDISGRAELDISGQTLAADLGLSMNPVTRDEIRADIENGSIALAAGSGATGLALNVSDIHGAILIDSRGIAGVMNAGDITLKQLDGSDLPGININKVGGVSVGFNTMGEAVEETIGATYFDFSEDKFHDFFAINANLDLGLTVGPVTYNLAGQFGFTKTQMEIVSGEGAQDILLMSLTQGDTYLKVGDAPGGAMVRLSGLQGAGLISNINGEFGAVGSLTIGSIALTEADGVTPLVAGLSMLPLNLPFDFNLFDLDPNLNLSLTLPEIDLTLASFPYVDLGDLGLPSLNLPDLDLAAILPNIELPDLSLPELGFALPSLGLPDINISFPNVDLNWPYLSLADLNLAYPDLGLDFPNLSFPELMFALPRLN
ncbi:beta strand repeat-containing protein, partial [Maribrevibacterium harenarium]|uniref:beta strand repeat-containing protein n=1 Tax=Maribrevibacterium harenarium TaxID=2589817 RepID=UPI0015E36607